MRRTTILGIAGVLTIIALSVVWLLGGPEPSGNRPDLASRLADWARQAEVGDRVDLADLLVIEYERVGVITPYLDNQHARSVLGVDWDAEATPGYRSERWVELVFIINGRPATWFAVDTEVVDIHMPNLQPGIVERGRAFVVRRTYAPDAPAVLVPDG